MDWWWDSGNVQMVSLRKQGSCKTLFRVSVIEMGKDGIP